MTTPSFDLSIFPPALRERIEQSRATFAGYSMLEGDGGEGSDSSSDGAGSSQSDQQGQGGGSTRGEGSSDSESRSGVDIDVNDDSDLSALPPKVRSYIEKLRGEAGSQRVKAKSAESDAQAKLSAALKALGVETDEDSDPLEVARKAAEESTVKATAEREQRTLTAAELIVWRKADQLGVDAASLADSRSFERAIKGLDPDDAGFDKAVTEKIKKIIEDNPRYGVQVARKGGADLSGRGRKQDNSNRRVSLTDAVSSHYNNS